MNNINNYFNNFIEGLNQGIGANLSNIPVALVLAFICYFIYKSINRIFKSYSHKLPIDKKVVKSLNGAIDGLVIFLTPELHRTGKMSIHGNPRYWKEVIKIQELAERVWCEYYNKTPEDFEKRYHKHYL